MEAEFITGHHSWELVSSHFNKEGMEGSGWGCPNYLSHEKCKELLVDGVFEVKVIVKTPGNKLAIGGEKQKPDESGRIKQLNKTIFEDMLKPDFTIVCDGQPIPCHQNILAGASDYFKALMVREFVESRTGSAEIQCSAEIGQALIKYIYTGEIEVRLLEENAEIFLQLGEMYNLKQLKALAEHKMLDQLTKENMASFFVAGNLHMASGIREAAKKFILMNFSALRENKGWKEMFGGNNDLLIELLLEGMV